MAVARRLLRVVGIVLALVLVLLALAYGVLQTPAVRGAIAAALSDRLSRPGVADVTVGRLEGRLPQHIRLRDVSVADRRGRWLHVDELTVRWKPLELLQRRVHVTDVEAGRIDLRRLPAGAAPGSPPAPSQAGGGGAGFALAADRIAVDRLLLGGPVLGEPMALGLEAVTERDADGIRFRAEGERRDGRTGAFDADVTYAADTERLHVEVHADEPAGGLMARALQWRGLPALTVDLAGDGRLDRWRGTLDIAADAKPALHAALDTHGLRPLAFDLAGAADVAPLVPEGVRTLFEPHMEFAAAGAYDAVRRRLALQCAQIESPAARAEAAGTIDLANATVAANVRLASTDAAALADVLGGARMDRLAADGSVVGPLRRPRIALDGVADGLRLPGIAARTARVHALYAPSQLGQVEGLMVGVDVSGRAEGLAVDSPDVQALLGESVAFEAHGAYDVRAALFALDALTATGRAATVEGGGVYVADTGDWATDAAAALTNVEALRARAPMLTEGSARANLRLRGSVPRRTVDGTVRADARDLKVDQPLVQALVGSDARVETEIAYAPDDGLHLTDLRAEGAHVSANGALAFGPDFATFAANYDATVPDVQPLGAATGIDLAGALSLTGMFEGAPRDPSVAGRAHVSGARVRELGFGDVDAEYALEDVATAPAGRMSLRTTGPFGGLDGGARLAVEDRTLLAVRDLNVQCGDATVSGALTRPLDGAVWTGTLEGSVGDLQQWRALTPRPMAGAVMASIALAPQDGTQTVKGTATATGLQIETGPGRTVGAANATLELDARDVLGEPTGTAALNATTLTAGSVALESLTVNAEGSPAHARVDVAASGDAPVALELNGAADIERTADRVAATVASLDGQVAGQPLRLERAATVRYGPEESAVEDLALAFGGGRLDGAARLTPQQVQIDLEARAFPLALAGLVSPRAKSEGQLDAEAHVAGTPDAPQGEFNVRAQVAQLDPALGADLPPLTARAAGTLAGGRVTAEGGVTGIEGTEVHFTADAPVRLSVAPPKFAIPETEPLKGEVTLRGRVAPMWALVPIDGHRVDGRADVALRVAGTPAAPRLEGRAELTEGEYENFLTGTLLRDAHAVLEADGTRLRVVRAEASDGNAGTLTGGGYIDVAPAAGYPLDVQLKFTDAHLVRRDDVDATAGGTLAIAGAVRDATLRGEIETSLVELRLVSDLPPEVERLEVVEVNLPPGREEIAPPEADGSAVALDLTLRMPRRVFLRGRGLDSEWAGELHVGGTQAEPLIAGTLHPVRGEFTFAGKIFTLREGAVEFDGSAELDPELDLSAEYEAPELTAIIRIAGRASRPDISLSSRPELPEDEILSQVLFGKGRGQLTAWEALQLADTLAALTGTGPSSTGIFDVARKTLGVDVLRVRGGEDGTGPTVEAGRYVTEDVYVGVEQGATTESTAVSVEVEVTPSVSVESKVRQNTDSSIGVKWERDY